MKLTRDQRFTAYCIMLKIAEDNTQYRSLSKDELSGLCDIFSLIFGFYPYVFIDFDYEDESIHGFEYYLPELWKKRTTNIWYQYWFLDTPDSEFWEVRKRALIKCINETGS